MNVNFTGGLVRIGNRYVKPENITYIQAGKPGNFTIYHNSSYNEANPLISYYGGDVQEFAAAVVKAEKTGQIIDLNG